MNMPTKDPIKLREKRRRWRARHPDKVKFFAARRRAKSRDYINANLRRWRAENPDRVRRHQARSELKFKEKRKAYKKLPMPSISTRMRKRLHQLFGRSSKSGRLVRFLGCSMPQFMNHLEMLFEPGMTWENRGRGWHVDHIRPLSSFDLTDQAQAAKACHYTNLQPLWAFDNLSKGAKTFP